MATDRLDQRHQGRRRCAHPIGQDRDVERHALAGIGGALAGQRQICRPYLPNSTICPERSRRVGPPSLAAARRSLLPSRPGSDPPRARTVAARADPTAAAVAPRPIRHRRARPVTRLDDPSLLRRRPPPTPLRARQNRYCRHGCPLTRQLTGAHLSRADLSQKAAYTGRVLRKLRNRPATPCALHAASKAHERMVSEAKRYLSA
jgi:hypothetical protein